MSATPTPTSLHFPRLRSGISTGPGSSVSTAVHHSQSIPVVLWIHESNPSNPKPEAIFNYDLFPHGAARPGDLIEVIPLEEYVPPPPPTGRTGAEAASNVLVPELTFSDAGVTDGATSARKASRDGSIFDKDRKRFLFVIREWSPEERAKQPNLQVGPDL